MQEDRGAERGHSTVILETIMVSRIKKSDLSAPFGHGSG